MKYILTEREQQVLKLLCEGFNNREIAKALFISPHTSKAHVEAITRKLNARNRTSAAFIAGAQGLITK